ncbi:MAG: bacteriohemerythrin [Mariprofundus sp.]|nr:bacteriohemerythrin [Mariprofundus sp.]
MWKIEGHAYKLSWSDAMCTGVEAIDNDHKKLLALIIQLSVAIDGNSDKAAIEVIFSELEHYILQHFSREEALMRDCQYDRLESHIKLHQSFVEAIPALKEKLLTSTSKQVAEETYLFLYNWLINHIVGEDMQFAQLACAHGLASQSKEQESSLLKRFSLAFARHLALPRRVLMISLLPIIGMIALSLFILSGVITQVNEMKALQNDFHIIHLASTMNHSLQTERALSSAYIGSKHQQFAVELAEQRRQTNAAATQFTSQVQMLMDKPIDPTLLKYIQSTQRHLAKLDDYRQRIDNDSISIQETLNYYSEFIIILRDLPDSMIHLNMASDLSNNIIAFSAMMHLKETYGLQRAMGARVLTGQRVPDDDLQTYLSLIRERHGTQGMFKHASTLDQQQVWQIYQNKSDNNNFNTIERNFVTLLGTGSSDLINHKQWFKTYTTKINQIMVMSEYLLQQLTNKTEHKISALYTKLYISAAVLIGLILLTILFSRLLIYSITYPVKRMTHAMTSLSEGDRSIRFHDTFAKDELDSMANAYEKCRISLLQADLAMSVYVQRQTVDLKRKLCEQKVKSSIQDYALDCIITCDKTFIITDINPSTEALFRLDKTAAIGQSLSDLLTDIDNKALNARFETQASKSDHTKFSVEASISNISFDEFEGYICFIRDVSAYKKAAENIQKLSQAIEQAGESIIIANRAGVIEYVNTAFTKLTGYSTAEAIGNTPRILKSGNQDDAFYQQMWQTITHGEIWQNKVVERRKDGSFFPVILTIAPITNNEGIITHFVGSHADISELENMEEQFRQAQKMEAIGTLVGGIAHDFNNMLAGITGNLYLAKRNTADMPLVNERLNNIEELSFRAATMIKQLLTFARKDLVSIEPMPLTPFVKETMKFLQTSIPENIHVEQHICSHDLTVKADTTQLHQVLMNLINNACDAIEDVNKPRISICLDSLKIDKAFVATHQAFSIGQYAHLSIADNGCGIRPEHLQYVFDPFFTNKEEGKGTGLGLSMVYGAITNHQGHIEVQSIAGEGATFHIYLPLQAEQAIAPHQQSEQSVTPYDVTGKLILLADDQPFVLEIAQQVLEAMGYKTLIAENGQRAVELYRAHAAEIDLCVFDVVMPIMGGDKAAKSIRQINPQVKIIFSTGYDRTLLEEMDDETILSKPYDFNEMNRLIQDMLSNG